MGAKLIYDRMSASLDKLQANLDRLPAIAYDKFLQNTPKDEGNARRKTQLKGNTVHANYPYAERLDQGYSKQSPDGMSKPTSDHLTVISKLMVRK